MPLDVVIAPAEDCFWPDLQDTDMRLKIRVRRMKQGRELRGVYSPGRTKRGMCERNSLLILADNAHNNKNVFTCVFERENEMEGICSGRSLRFVPCR